MRRVLIPLSVMLLLSWGTTNLAWAHTASKHYNMKWPETERNPVTWHPTSSFLAQSGWFDVAVVADNAWGDVGQPYRYMDAPKLEPDPPAFSCPSISEVDRNALHALPKSSVPIGNQDSAAFVRKCHRDWPTYEDESVIENFQMVIVTDSVSWYAGLATSVPPGKVDLFSALVHEFGHASGWSIKHFEALDGSYNDNSNLCPTGSNRHTMCPSLDVEWYMRTLNDHDIDTFKNAHPKPPPPNPRDYDQCVRDPFSCPWFPI